MNPHIALLSQVFREFFVLLICEGDYSVSLLEFILLFLKSTVKIQFVVLRPQKYRINKFEGSIFLLSQKSKSYA